jgi:hypothetical protein
MENGGVLLQEGGAGEKNRDNLLKSSLVTFWRNSADHVGKAILEPGGLCRAILLFMACWSMYRSDLKPAAKMHRSKFKRAGNLPYHIAKYTFTFQLFDSNLALSQTSYLLPYSYSLPTVPFPRFHSVFNTYTVSHYQFHVQCRRSV